MIEWISALLLIIGSFFMFLAALGIYRFPDIYTRMHAATKASSFGAGLMLIGLILHLTDFWIIFEAIVVIVFIFMTAPVAAHMIGRAAYLIEVPLWENTVIDELKGQYDLKEKILHSK